MAVADASFDKVDANYGEINAVLLVLFFILSYTDLTFSLSDHLTFPDAGCFFVAIASFVVNSGRIEIKAAKWVAAIMGVLVLDAVATSLADPYFSKRLLAALHCSISIASAYGVFLAATGAGLDRLSRIFCIIYFVILIGSLLEVTGIIRWLSDDARVFLYGKDIYMSSSRDVETYGAVRPDFFAREPSLVGINSSLALCIWILTRNNRSQVEVVKSLILLVVFSGASTLIIRSPTIEFFFLISAAGLFFLSVPVGKYQGYKRATTAGMVMLFCFLFLPMIIATGYLSGNWASQRVLSDPSAFERVVAPPIVTLSGLMDKPILGFGVGAFDALSPYIFRALGASGFLQVSHLDTDPSTWIGNAFWEYWAWGGVAGGIGFIVLTRKFLQSLGLRETYFPFVAIALAMQNFGGFIVFRTWYIILMCAALTYLWSELPRSTLSDRHPAV